jgi:hypothetical protein
MAQETIMGPDGPREPFNTADETPETGWNPKRIITAINAMFTELYTTFVTEAALEAVFPAGIVILNGAGVPDDTATATLSTALTGDNNDLDYTSVLVGAAGNTITIEYVDPEAADAVLAVSVVETAITFHLATDELLAITTTADDIKTALLASVEASALVTAADKAANDGSGVVTALEATALADGADAAGQTVAGCGSLYSDTTNGDLYINSGDADAVVWKLITRAA